VGGIGCEIMARLLRVAYAGAIYHVTVRSNSGARLFWNDRDRAYWLYRLGESAQAHAVRVHLYCLMRNHFHLLVETPQGNLGRCMHALLTGYSIFFNRSHRRHGHVTQGRYGARLVAGDEYLLKLSRYVHLNPGMTAAARRQPLAERLKLLREYPWSSLRAYRGAAPPPPWLVREPTLARLGGRGAVRQRRYAEFVEAGLAQEDEEFKSELLRSALGIGDETFRAEVDERYGEVVRQARRAEDAALRKTAPARVSVAVVLDRVARAAGVGIEELQRRRRGRALQAVAARLLGRYAGLTQRDIAPLLGLTSGSSVSCQLRRLPARLAADPTAKRLMEAADRAVTATQRGGAR